MKKAWTLEIDGQRIAWLTFDQPGEKVNTFTASVLGELDQLLDEVMARGGIQAVVVVSGKPEHFVAGADIDELVAIADEDDARSKADVGHWLFRKLAALRMPTVAAIHGACLGGGLEMALACDYRLATDHPRTSIGLPEVGLGIIPGWGGTYRLPRLVGLPTALQMIASGRPVNGRKAARIGLVDGIVAPGFLREQTVRFLEQVRDPAGAATIRRRRLRRQPRARRWLCATPSGRRLVCRLASRQVRAKTKGHYPAPLEAITVVRRSFGKRAVDAARIEKDAFARLACTPISRHLVWLFQASRRAKRIDVRGSGRQPRLERAAVIGAGIMGGGIAWALSRSGMPVRLKDISWDAVTRGTAAAASIDRGMVKRRKLSEAEATLAMHRISPCVDYAGFRRVDVVIEAVTEDLGLKCRVLREIEEHVAPDTIICTNTSSLSLRELSAALRNPKRFVGLHFFNPVHRMPLVEVVAGPQTLKRAVVAAAELVRRMEKTPLVVGDCPGFLVNRILLPYLIESAWMFEEGVDPQRIDRLLERFGMPMGPLALVDEVGLDVGYEVAKVLEGAYGERMRVPAALGDVALRGDLLGRKSGRGFYVYDNGHRKLNPEVLELGRAARHREGREPIELDDDVIVDRAVLIMVNEAARCLEEGVVDDPGALDLAMVMGTGFAPFRGGLLRYADDRGVIGVKERLEQLAERFGDRFAPAPLIGRIVGNGGHFHHVAEPPTNGAASRRNGHIQAESTP